MKRGEKKSMRFLFCKALIGLLAFDLFLARKFAKMHRIVHEWKVMPRDPSPEDVEHVCNELNLACVWYPKQALCLQRSAILTCLLRSCGIPAQMVLGAQKLPFKAHAWVEVNGRAVNERSNVQAAYGVWD